MVPFGFVLKQNNIATNCDDLNWKTSFNNANHITVTLTEEKKELKPLRVIFNNPATVVFWNDGTKTVVKCESNEEFSEYYGFCCAVAKKMFGSNSAIKTIVNNAFIQNKKVEENG